MIIAPTTDTVTPDDADDTWVHLDEVLAAVHGDRHPAHPGGIILTAVSVAAIHPANGDGSRVYVQWSEFNHDTGAHFTPDEADRLAQALITAASLARSGR